MKTLVIESGESRAALLLISESVSGRTCPHAACYFGHVTIVDFLLSLSCAGLVGLRDRSGYTALEHAVVAGHTAAAEAIRAASESGRPAPPRPS